jgi:hypothetical protein
MLRFYPERTKLLFFDLEYYVPLATRSRKSLAGMLFAPSLPGHKILGGTFQCYYPMQDRLESPVQHWEWQHGSEKDLLHAIYKLLRQHWKSISTKPEMGSLMLGGIGISHSDVPALLWKLVEYRIAAPDEAYDTLCGCRQIDLSTATFCQFAFNTGYFAYPKTKSHLYQKYLEGKQMESGKSVWEAYEARNYKSIEARSKEEITDAIAIYKSMVELKKKTDSDLRRLRKIERKESTMDANDA